MGVLTQASVLTVSSVSDAHVAGDSRQVDSGEHAEHAAAAASGECAEFDARRGGVRR